MKESLNYLQKIRSATRVVSTKYWQHFGVAYCSSMRRIFESAVDKKEVNFIAKLHSGYFSVNVNVLDVIF